MGQPKTGYPIFYNVIKGGMVMLNFCKPTWPKYISKLSFIKFILKSKELSKKQKIMMILFVLRMEKSAKWRTW